MVGLASSAQGLPGFAQQMREERAQALRDPHPHNVLTLILTLTLTLKLRLSKTLHTKKTSENQRKRRKRHTGKSLTSRN